jgi:hypothetical protein
MGSHEPKTCWICGREVDSGDLTQLWADVHLGRVDQAAGRVDQAALPLLAHGWCMIITMDSSQRGVLEQWLLRNAPPATPKMT